MGKTQSSVTQKLTERQQEIVRLIKENNTISAGSMATTLGVTVRSIRRDIEVIRKYCSIQWIGPSKSGHWELKQQ